MLLNCTIIHDFSKSWTDFYIHFIIPRDPPDLKNQPLKNLDENGKSFFIPFFVSRLLCENIETLEARLFINPGWVEFIVRHNGDQKTLATDNMVALYSGLNQRKWIKRLVWLPPYPSTKMHWYCHYGMRHSTPAHIPPTILLPLQDRGCIFSKILK